MIHHSSGYDTFMVGMSITCFVLVVGAMITLSISPRARATSRSQTLTGGVLPVVFPIGLLLGMFAWGYSIYKGTSVAPSDAMEIQLTGKKWQWEFKYPNGRSTVGEVYIPVHRPVKFVIASNDVVHSLLIPSFRVKEDAIPGRSSSVWIQATLPGIHPVYCTEFCGDSHSTMQAKLVVLSELDWKRWIEGPGVGTSRVTEDSLKVAQASVLSQKDLIAQGKQLTKTKGCVACHSSNGERRVGPSYRGLYNHPVTLEDGTHVLADKDYIRESIESPQAKLVKGYTRVMPSFKGLITEQDLAAITAYIQSLK